MNAKPVVRLRIERKEQKQQQFEANKIASKQKNDKLYLPYEREREVNYYSRFRCEGII
jgi:hypothetical protein